MTGFVWRRLDSMIPMTRGDRQMLAIGRECGIDDGYTVPRFLPGATRGTCTFAVRPGQPLPAAQLVEAEIVGAMALTSARRMSFRQDSPPPATLSDRQRECVIWSARGKTAGETATILGISIETVIQHLKLARERTGVHCRQALVLKALYDGLIGFGDIYNWRQRMDTR